MPAFQAGQIVVAKRGEYCLEICHSTFVSPVIFSCLFCIMLFVLWKISRLVSLGELTQALLGVCCNWSTHGSHFRLKTARATAQGGLLTPAAYSIVGEENRKSEKTVQVHIRKVLLHEGSSVTPYLYMCCGREFPSQIIFLKAHQNWTISGQSSYKRVWECCGAACCSSMRGRDQ